MFETILFLTCLVAAAIFAAKIYEWRQDVLYGPYIESEE
jgi:hypothetical protein